MQDVEYDRWENEGGPVARSRALDTETVSLPKAGFAPADLLDAVMTRLSRPVAKDQAAVLIREDGSEEQIVLTDASEGGVGFVAANPPRVGEHVLIRVIGRHELAAEIRWASGQRAGGAFE